MRAAWSAIPAHVRAEIDRVAASPVVEAANINGGFSPGPAARCELGDGRRVFVKAGGTELNPHTPDMHRREAEVLAALGDEAPAPMLLGAVDDGDWVALVIEWVDGRMPVAPITLDALRRILDLAVRIAETRPPGTLRPAGEELAAVTGHWAAIAEEPTLAARLDPWAASRLDRLIEMDAMAIDAMAGSALVHFDLRTDNVLFSDAGPEHDIVVDWANAAVGAEWIDLAASLPALHLDGGPPPSQVFTTHALGRSADPSAVDAFVVAVGGYFTRNAMLPAPPGLPTLRAFQAAQGEITMAWIAERIDGPTTMHPPRAR